MIGIITEQSVSWWNGYPQWTSPKLNGISANYDSMKYNGIHGYYKHGDPAKHGKDSISTQSRNILDRRVVWNH